MRFLAAFVVGGRLQAVLVLCGSALASLLLPPLGVLSTALLALRALRKGGAETAAALALALLVTGLLGATTAAGALPAIVYGLLLWLPVWPVAEVLRISRRLSFALLAAAALAYIAILAMYASIDDPAALWRERLHGFAQPMLDSAPEGFDTRATRAALDRMAHYATGAVVAGSMVSTLLGLLIARWQQAMLYNPGGFRREFIALQLPKSVALAGLGGVILGLVGDARMAEIAWNCNAIVGVLMLFAGFAITHAIFSGKRFWLMGIYLALFLIPQILLPLIALCGATDPWLDWRKRPQT